MKKLDSQKHDLAHYVEEINLAIQQDYSQIQTRVKQDPGTAGDQAEETWAEVLRKWLPEHYHVVTKGRVISASGDASNQIDILVLWPSYPPFMLKKKLYLASGVAAAFECKLTLKKAHLRKLFETAVQLSDITEQEHRDRKRQLRRNGNNYSYQEFHRIFEYGLLAHAYEGDNPQKVTEKLNEEIVSLDKELVRHPKQMVDLICVQGLGSWVSERSAIFSRPIMNDTTPPTYKMQYLKHPYTNYKCLTEDSWAKGSYIHSNFSPLGSFLARLYRKLSRVDSSLIPLAKFFSHTLSTGQGGGDGGRLWPEIETPDDIWQMSANARRINNWLEDYNFLGF